MKTLLIFLLASFKLFAAEDYIVNKVTYLSINSSINPATFNYIESGLEKLSPSSGDMLVIKLNTPGGLVSTTKDILTLFGESDIPIAVWITPEGASATSAGAIISSGAHLLFMSPGTNIGAATPINMDGDIKQSDSKSKAINDIAALVASLSDARGRNAEKFKLMITKAESFDSKTALKEKVIDHVVSTKKELRSKIDSTKIKIKGKEYKLVLNENATNEVVKMGAAQSILNIFAHPTVSYILFLLGAALIYFELQSPGGVIAGSLGALSLLLAGIGFQVLPLNFGAMGLMILAFALFILEAYITSYGVLSIAGLAAMIIGSMFLFDTPNSYIELDPAVIFSGSAAIFIYVVVVGYMIFKSKPDNSFFSDALKEGVITKILDESENLYQLKIEGEIWSGKAATALKIGDKVQVTNHDDITLDIKLLEE